MNEAAIKRILSIDDDYSGDTRLFVNYLRSTDQDICVEALINWTSVLKEEGRAVATINRRASAIKNRIRLLFSESGEQAFNTFEWFKAETDLKKMKKQKINSKAVDPSKILSKEEIQTLVDESSERIGLFMQFLYTTGCRISEAINIRNSDIRKTKKYMIIRLMGKGDKERFVNISAKFYRRVSSSFNGNSYLFETRANTKYDRNYLGLMVRLNGQKILNRRVTPHFFRHSFATHMIADTGKIKAVSKYLGHHSTSLTMDMYNQEQFDFSEIPNI